MSKSVSAKEKKRRVASYVPSVSASQNPNYLPGVIEKLKKHKEFKELSDDDAKVKAIQLTDPHELHVYFSHLLDLPFEDQVRQVREEADDTDYGEDLTNDRERDAAKARTASTFQQLCEMPIKLQLSELNRDNIPPRFAMDQFAKLFALKYGPLHAALAVGDVTLEWNDTSLVVPEPHVIEPDIQMDVRAGTTAMKSITSKEPLLEAAVDSLDFKTQMDLIYDVTADRGRMIEALIKVIAKYNKYHEYHLLTRNCQTFVIDAMKAIGIENPPKMTGRLKEYYTELCKGKKKVPDDFKTHEDLDQYVSNSQDTGEFAQLTQHDKEFLLCLYFKFHLETLKEDKCEACQISNCMKDEVERAIESPLILTHFRE